MKSNSIIAKTRVRTATGIVLSLLFHALILWIVVDRSSVRIDEAGNTLNAPLSVHLIPPGPTQEQTASASAALHRAQPKSAGHPKEKARKEQTVARKKVVPPSPDRLALTRPTPKTERAPAAAPTDMMDMLTAARDRRRAAGVPDANDSNQKPEQDDNAIARANVEFSMQAQSRGRNDGGGVFQVTFKGVRTAELIFRGWDVRRRSNTRQLLEVDAGLNGDIDTAIVRKMIELIRQYQSGDFNWESRRLGRVVVLSARVQDNAELEDFLKKDFFVAYR